MRKAAFFISSLLFLMVGCSEQSTATVKRDKNEKTLTTDLQIFQHGVASGDPLSDRVIIWTRVSTKKRVANVQWEISETENFDNILQTGILSTDATRDYTIKADVEGLSPGTCYYYRFTLAGKLSAVGRTKTLPTDNVEEVNLGIVSCSNYEFGYFNAYNGLAKDNLDAILHLGDYIYEYGPDKYGDKNFTRKHLPPKEITTLRDYRIRYAQYREDKALQLAHQSHPFIMIWDDHEIANNAYKTGAQNHQKEEGDYMTRKVNAKKAYYEWQPIRENKNDEIYRSFSYGDLVDIIMLDERYTGREEPAATKDDAAGERTMLGAEQLVWFKGQLKNSTSQWKIIGNQVIFAPCDLSLVRPDSPVNLDAWDGYAHERDDIRSFLSTESIQNVIFVTGDTHTSWAFDVPTLGEHYPDSGASCAVEIGTPSITSSNWNDSENATDKQAMMGEQALIKTNPHLKYVNGRDHGYTVVSLTKEGANAKWYYSSDIKVLDAPITLAHEVKIAAGAGKLSN